MADAARKGANELKAAAEEAKRAADEAARTARDATGVDKGAARKVANDLRDQANAARDAAKAAEENARALESTNDGAIKATTRALKDQADAAEKAHSKNLQMAERTRNIGAGTAVVGGAGIAETNSLAQDYQDGAKATGELEVMFHKIGETDAAISDLKENMSGLAFDAAMPDDDPLNAAAAGLAGFGIKAEQVKGIMPGLIGQSRLYNESLDSVAEAFGRAFAKGDAAGLRRSGVVISEADEDRIKNITNEAERQKAVYEVVKQSMDRYALSMTEGMSAGEIAANRQALALDGMREAIGKGSSEGKAQIDGLSASLFQMVGANPEMARQAGLLLAYGSYGTAAAGGIVAMAAQFFLAVNSGREFLEWLKEIQTARLAAAAAADVDTAATATNAAAQTAGVGATGAAGAAALSSSLEFDALTAAEGGAAIAADAEAVSMGTAGAATAAAGAEAGLASVAFSGLGMIAGGIGVVIGAAMAGAIYWVGELTGALDNSKTMMESLGDGWNALKDTFTGGNSAGAGANQRDLNKGLADIKAKNSAAVLHGTKTQDQADKDSTAEEIKLRDTYAREADRQGDKKMLVEQQEATARLRKQQQTPAPVPAIAPPLAPAAASSDVTLTGGDNSSPDSENDAAPSAAPATKSEVKAQKAAAKVAEREAKRQTAAAAKLAKTAEREAKAAEKEADADDLALMRAQDEIEAANETERLEAELADAKEAGNAAEVGRLTYEIEQAKAEKEYQDAMAAASQLDAGKHRDTQERIAQMRYEAKESGALTKGHKAEAATGKEGGGKVKPLTQSETDALFNASGGGSRDILTGAYSALNPVGSGGAGNRFAGMDAFVIGGPSMDFSGMERSMPSVGDFGRGAGSRGTQKREFQAKQRQISQDSRGNYRIKFDDIEIPYQDPFGGWDGD